MRWYLLPLLFAFSRIEAQTSDSIRTETLSFYFTGQVAVPSAEFQSIINNSISNLGAGVSAGFVFSPLGKRQASPALLGIDFGYFNYGIDKTPASANRPPLKSTFNVFTWSGIIRVRPPNMNSRFVPFADGLIGVKILNTITKIHQDALATVLNSSQPEVLSRINNTGLNYGVGAGFAVYSKKIQGLAFTMRAIYMWGADIEYVVRGSVAIDSNGYITYKTSTINTSLLSIQIGVQVSNFVTTTRH
jgi:hypothetical protein